MHFSGIILFNNLFTHLEACRHYTPPKIPNHIQEVIYVDQQQTFLPKLKHFILLYMLVIISYTPAKLYQPLPCRSHLTFLELSIIILGISR